MENSYDTVFEKKFAIPAFFLSYSSFFFSIRYKATGRFVSDAEEERRIRQEKLRKKVEHEKYKKDLENMFFDLDPDRKKYKNE